jgi:hypothetical protein
MTREEDGFSYRSADLHKGASGMVNASGVLDMPLRLYEAYAAPTGTCFGLVPQGSEELAKNYREFFDGVKAWVRAYGYNVQGAGLGLEQVRINYDAVDRPGR